MNNVLLHKHELHCESPIHFLSSQTLEKDCKIHSWQCSRKHKTSMMGGKGKFSKYINVKLYTKMFLKFTGQQNLKLLFHIKQTHFPLTKIQTT